MGARTIRAEGPREYLRETCLLRRLNSFPSLSFAFCIFVFQRFCFAFVLALALPVFVWAHMGKMALLVAFVASLVQLRAILLQMPVGSATEALLLVGFASFTTTTFRSAFTSSAFALAF